MRKKSKPRTLSNHSKPTKLHPRSAGNVDVALGRRIRLRRVEIGLSQSELGEKLGVSFQQAQKYEGRQPGRGVAVTTDHRGTRCRHDFFL